MKVLRYLFTCAALTLFILPSCTDEENKSRFGNKAYLSGSEKTTLMLIEDTPEFVYNLAVSTAKPLEEDVEFVFRAAPELVSAYNEGFYTDTELLPSENYELIESTVLIAQGSSRSTDFSIRFLGIDEIDRDKKYVLPVTFASKNGEIDLIESNTTHYYLVRAGSIINWAADITENNFPVSGMGIVTELTWEMWLWLDNIDPRPDANIRSVIGKEGTFLIRLSDSGWDIDHIQIVNPGGTNQPANESERVSFPVQKWTHLALTCDKEGDLKLYLDAELRFTTNIGAGWSANLSSDFHIGKSYNDNRWWTGMITEARVWSIPRTQAEIEEFMYEVDPNTAGLTAYWKFNEGEGNTITDHSPNGLNITSASSLTWVSIGLPEVEE